MGSSLCSCNDNCCSKEDHVNRNSNEVTYEVLEKMERQLKENSEKKGILDFTTTDLNAYLTSTGRFLGCSDGKSVTSREPSKVETKIPQFRPISLDETNKLSNKVEKIILDKGPFNIKFLNEQLGIDEKEMEKISGMSSPRSYKLMIQETRNLPELGPFRYEETGCDYIGQYIENKRHGYGELVWADGSIFEGQFLDDRMDGLGNFYLV